MQYVLIALSLLVFSCTKKPTCKQVSSAAKLGAVASAALLDCSNLDAIEKDIINEMESLNVCKSINETVKPTGNPLICGTLASYLAQQAVNAIPEKWECKGGLGLTTFKAGVYKACVVYFPG